MPSYVFVVDGDVRILDYNAAAGGLLGIARQDILRHRAGDLLHCIRAAHTPGGCGRSSHCRNCVIRSAVAHALAGSRSFRTRARMQLLSAGKTVELYALITATPFAHDDTQMVLLVIEDISEIAELQRIVPICMHCKKVRADDQYWTQVEAYFARHWDLRFSHGFCPDCQKAEMARLGLHPKPPPAAPAPSEVSESPSHPPHCPAHSNQCVAS